MTAYTLSEGRTPAEAEHRLDPVGLDKRLLGGDVGAARGVGDVENVEGLLGTGRPATPEPG